jgi:hypothetical protein
MGEKFDAVLDITIVYPDGQPTFTHFLMGRVKRVIVRVRILPVPKAKAVNGQSSEQALRDTCQQWVNALWQDKDALISQIIFDKNSL